MEGNDPFGSLPSITCYIPGPTPTLSPSFPLAQGIFEQIFSRINTPSFLKLVILHLPAYEDGTDRVFQNVEI